MIQNAFHVQQLQLLVYNVNKVNIFLREIPVKNAQLTVTAVLILDVMSAGEASQKMKMANVEDALFIVLAVILMILRLAPLVQLAFN